MPRLDIKSKISLDSSGFQAGLRKAEKGISKFGSDLKSKLAGAFTAAAIIAYAKSVGDLVTRIKDAANQYRLTTEEVQKLDFAARRNGLTMEQVGQAIDKLGTSRKRAAEGDEKMRVNLSRLGISLDDINDSTKSNLDLVARMSSELSVLGHDASVTASFLEILGESGGRVAAAFKDFREGAGNVTIIGKEDLDRLDAAIKKLEEIELRLKAKTVPVLVEVAGDVDKAASGGVRGFLEAVRKNLPSGISARLSQALVGKVTGKFLPKVDETGLTPDALPLPPNPERLFTDFAALKREADLAKAQVQFMEEARKTNFMRLKDDEKRLEIMRRINNLEVQAAEFNEDEPERFNALRSLEQEKQRLMSLDKQAGTFTPSGDALSRIGGIAPGAIRMDNIAREQLSELMKMNSTLRTGVKIEDLD